MSRWNGLITNCLAGLGLAALLAFQTKPAQTKPTQAKPTPKKTTPAKSAATKPAAQPPLYNRLKSGVEYRVYKRENGRYVRRPAVPPTGDPAYRGRLGQVLAVHMEIRTGQDSVLMSTRQQMQGQLMRVGLDTLRRGQRGGMEEALSLLQAGDSGVFRFAADSIFYKSFRQPVPPFVRRAGNKIIVLAKAVKLQTPAAAQQDVQLDMQRAQEREQQLAAQRAPEEDARIQAYLKENQLTGPKTSKGTYYIVTQLGTGPKPQPGQTVAVLYQGALLNGKVFDASVRHGNQPIEFVLGQGQVIQGWDDGIAQLPKGSKAILLIPSGQGYGARGAGADIPPYAILRFDVELVDVK